MILDKAKSEDRACIVSDGTKISRKGKGGCSASQSCQNGDVVPDARTNLLRPSSTEPATGTLWRLPRLEKVLINESAEPTPKVTALLCPT